MIIGVWGLPGMGKTSFLTKAAQKCLQGKSFLDIPVHSRVFTNFECKGCYKLDFDKLGVYQYEDALILIDEIMLLADCRNFKTFAETTKYFMSHHRKYDTTVVYCSQFWRDADAKIRNLTDRYYYITRSSFLPVSIIKPIQREFTVRNGLIEDGYFLGAPITWRFVWRPHWYKFFDSYERRELKPLTPAELELWEFDRIVDSRTDAVVDRFVDPVPYMYPDPSGVSDPLPANKEDS